MSQPPSFYPLDRHAEAGFHSLTLPDGTQLSVQAERGTLDRLVFVYAYLAALGKVGKIITLSSDGGTLSVTSEGCLSVKTQQQVAAAWGQLGEHQVDFWTEDRSDIYGGNT